MKIGNLSVGKRLGLGFGAMVVLIVAVAGLGVQRLVMVASQTDSIVNDMYVQLELASGVRDLINDAASGLRDAMLSSDQEQVKKNLAVVAEASKNASDKLARLEKMLVTPKEKELFATLTGARGAYREAREPVLKAIADGKRDQAREQFFNAVVPAQKRYFGLVDDFVTAQEEEMKEAGVEADKVQRSAVFTMTSLAVVAAVLATVLAIWVTRSITRPLHRAVAVAQHVAVGDLTEVVEVSGNDEMAQLLRALKDMNESLGKIVGEVRASTDTITTASSEIAAGNQDLSQRTEEQASSLEETASSMEELTSTVKQNADNARQASQLATSASEIAVKGGAVVGDVVSTMGAISESSKKIADIIGVIDGIAFQTNILALNAAVEAARAGEQGRGFAVVAGEVRNLAQRSAGAAKEIKALIEDSVGKVDSGTKLVDQAGQTMEEVVSSIKRVTDIMAEITAASQEQSSGIEQVNQAVTQMDQVTQQNAALVEEAAAAAESMQQQAQALAQAVAVFKLDASHAKFAVTTKPVASVRKASFVERRGPTRAKNVARLPAASAKPAAAAKSGTDDEWTEF